MIFVFKPILTAHFVLIFRRMSKIPSALAPVVYIAGLAFEVLIRVRSRLYSASLLPRHRLPGPVISIGNITMGGTGKTPLVIYVAQTLSKLGFNPAVLSRGYGRRNPKDSWILPPGEIVPSPALILGDEPALIRRHARNAWMGISKDRHGIGRRIAERQTRTVFLLDDGFQHRRLHRDLDIVVVDRSQPLEANSIFPQGTLREPISELRRCHMIVINGMPEAQSDPVEAEIRSLHAEATIFHCQQTICSMIPFPAWKEGYEISNPKVWPRSAYLVSAVGNPGRFHRDIRQLGIEVRGTRFFRDHYCLRQNDWRQCVEAARSTAVDAMATTEKDAIKISKAPDFPLLVSVQSTEMSDARAFTLALKSCIEERA